MSGRGGYKRKTRDEWRIFMRRTAAGAWVPAPVVILSRIDMLVAIAKLRRENPALWFKSRKRRVNIKD